MKHTSPGTATLSSPSVRLRRGCLHGLLNFLQISPAKRALCLQCRGGAVLAAMQHSRQLAVASRAQQLAAGVAAAQAVDSGPCRALRQQFWRALQPLHLHPHVRSCISLHLPLQRCSQQHAKRNITQWRACKRLHSQKHSQPHPCKSLHSAMHANVYTVQDIFYTEACMQGPTKCHACKALCSSMQQACTLACMQKSTWLHACMSDMQP